jgi:antitoxin YefM
MNAIPLDTIRNDLDGVLARVLSDAEPVLLNTAEGGSVVIMPLDNFSAWQETAYLLSNPANAARLQQSLEEYKRGQFSERELDER